MSECERCGQWGGHHFEWCPRPRTTYATVTTTNTFDHNAPLPPAPNYRPREWETDTKDKP